MNIAAINIALNDSALTSTSLIRRALFAFAGFFAAAPQDFFRRPVGRCPKVTSALLGAGPLCDM